MEKTKKNKWQVNSTFLSCLKGSLVAVIISLIGILFFAFIIKLFNIDDNFLRPINQVIKAISILIGVFLGLKKDNEKGLVKGLMIGLCYTILAFFIFSLLNNKFNFDKTLLNDILFGGIMGAICGVIAINLKNKNQKK